MERKVPHTDWSSPGLRSTYMNTEPSSTIRTHLDPSELGTREYWDEAYKRELTNNADDEEDEGTIWFDDSGAEEKVIQYLEDLSESAEYGITKGNEGSATRIVDLGTGNGHMLFALREEGWRGDMVGVDYSETSVQLARRIASQRHRRWVEQAEAEEEEAPPGLETMRFDRWDILNEEPSDWLGERFHLVLDKGTFDAISLSAETDAQGRRICETYRERVLPLIKTGCFLIITSCNWTRKELLQWFETADGKLKLYEELKYPKFTFGGVEGQSVCTLVFQRQKTAQD